MPSAYSNEITGHTTSGAPAPPTFISKVENDTSVVLTYQLPSASENGEPLQPGAFSALHVYADTKSFLGRLEQLIGVEPQGKLLVTPAQAGQQVSITVTGLTPKTEYKFVARME